jgi:hypothetical protein
MRSNKFLDFFLLPKDYYAKLTDTSFWLYIGIVAVGIRDILMAFLSMSVNKPAVIKNIHPDIKTVLILLGSVLIIGIVDVICFSYPAFDVIKLFKRRNAKHDSMSSDFSDSSLLTKIIKAYILVNVIVTPLDVITHFAAKSSIANNSLLLALLVNLMGILSFLWFNGAITRALGVFFKIKNDVKMIVFILVVLWNELLGYALNYIINQLFIRL